MADIIRTFEVPNRVPGKLVFGPRRVLATFGSIETPTPATLPPVLCPPGTGVGLEACQSVAGIHISVNTAKEIDAGPGDAPADPGIAVSKEFVDLPIVEGAAQSITDPAATSHTVDLPATIAAGETLIGIIAIDGDSNGVTWPAGWTKILDSQGTASTDSLSVAWRKADGGEGASITVTSVATEEAAMVVYRLSGVQDPTVIPPVVNSVTSGTTTGPNPGNLTVAEFGKSAAWLFIAFYAGNGAGPETACPAGYGDDQSHANGTAIHIGACVKLGLQTGDENPGAFAKTGSAHWTAAALVVTPA